VEAVLVTFSGGSLLESHLRELSKKFEKAHKLRVGFLEGSTYPDGTSVAMVAAVNEFGQTRIHPNQPPRPFFRRMIAENSPSWGPALAKMLSENGCDAAKALDLLGAEIAGELQQSIADFTSPGLAPITIKRKGSTKPLIDTGQMLNAVKHEVE
jgi:hypothetical protein